MISSPPSGTKSSLLGEYASLLGDAVLRHRAHWAEQSQRVEAELANKMKSEFIANMSHELRTPLNAIIGFSRFIIDQPQGQLNAEQTQEYAGHINAAAEHLLAIINDILDISKLQSGRIQLVRKAVDLEDILHSARSFFVILAQDKEIRLTVDIADDLPLINGDAIKLRQVFVNLISNAIKFTPSGGSVTVKARRHRNQTIMVAIRDTGIGMTRDELRVALVPFGQVDAGHSRRHEGTGLGLPIARAITQLHGGEFSVTSEKGKGTEINMTLEAVPDTECDTDWTDDSRPVSESDLASTQPDHSPSACPDQAGDPNAFAQSGNPNAGGAALASTPNTPSGAGVAPAHARF